MAPLCAGAGGEWVSAGGVGGYGGWVGVGWRGGGGYNMATPHCNLSQKGANLSNN